MDKPSDDLKAWLSAIGTLSAAVNAGHDLKALLDLVAVTAMDLLGLSFCAVMLPDRDGKFLTVAGASGLPEQYIARINEDGPVRLGVGLLEGAPASRAYRTGRPCAVYDVHSEPAASWSDIARKQGYRSILAVPLQGSSGVLGTLNSYHKSPHEFSSSEIERLGLLAVHATIALTSSRILDDLREKHQLVVRSEDIHDRLLDVAVRSGGVGGIATALHELLDSAVVVRDEHGTAIAAEPPLSTPAVVLDDVGSIKVRRSGLVSERGPHVVADVRLGGDTVATVWLVDRAGDPDPLAVRALEHASVVLSLELLRQRTATEVEQKLRGELIADLLAGTDASSPGVQDRARLMGHNLTTEHRVLVAGLAGGAKDRGQVLFADSELARHAAREAIRLSSHLKPRPLVAEVDGALVALWPHDDSSTSAGEQVLRQAFSIVNRNASAIVACTRIGPEGIPAAYRQARGALAFAVADGSSQSVVTLDDLGAAGLLLQYADPAHLQSYAERTIGALRRYDADRGASLVQTLRVYLDCDLDRRAAGESLVLHPNTVSQRLRKIEALTGLNLQSPRSVIEARTAFVLTDVVDSLGAQRSGSKP